MTFACVISSGLSISPVSLPLHMTQTLSDIPRSSDISEEIMMIADVTGDGEINAKDALEILQFAVGKRDEFSVMKLFEEE